MQKNFDDYKNTALKYSHELNSKFRKKSITSTISDVYGINNFNSRFYDKVKNIKQRNLQSNSEMNSYRNKIPKLPSPQYLYQSTNSKVSKYNI